MSIAHPRVTGVYMYKKHKYDIIVILSVAALSVSVFLAVTGSLGIAVPCDLTQGCEAVLSSRYAKLFNIPLSFWGAGYFSGVIVCALLANHYRRFRGWLTGLLGAGAAPALGFLGIQFVVLKSVCQYCLVADILTIAMFLWDLNIEYNPQMR